MILSILSIVAVLTLYLLLFPTESTTVQWAFVVVAPLLGLVRLRVGPRILIYPALAATLLLALWWLPKLFDDDFQRFAGTFAALHATLLVLGRLVGGRTALWWCAWLWVVTLAILESRYLGNLGYEPALSQSLAALSAATTLSVMAVTEAFAALRGRISAPRHSDRGIVDEVGD